MGHPAKVVDLKRCQIFVAGCRGHVEVAMGELKRVAEPGFVGVVDADTDHLDNAVKSDSDLLVTETRDVEGLILKSPILKGVLAEHDLDPEVFGGNPELSAVLAAAELGCLRWISGRLGWQLSFPSENFSRFINPRTLKCNSKAMCAELAARNRSPVKVTAAQLEQELARAKAGKHDPFKVARGHDVTSILAWAIRRLRRNDRKDGAFIDAGLVETHLRLAYPRPSFENKSLFKELKQWERRNNPFVLLN